VNGILVIDKPPGFTSHDIVDIIRRKTGEKKVGHGGTLDPMATGVLVIMLGGSTKLASSFLNDGKEYLATLKLGIKTSTDDSSGDVIETRAVGDIAREVIDAAFQKFLGYIDQTPPMVSAVRHKGRKLYELARKGITVEREPRRICIHKLEIRRVSLPDIDFFVSCSKGTYIRTLCDDIGSRLGTGGHMSSLRRVRSGDYGIEDAVALDEFIHAGTRYESYIRNT